jgi:hypothetical protein
MFSPQTQTTNLKKIAQSQEKSEGVRAIPKAAVAMPVNSQHNVTNQAKQSPLMFNSIDG